MPQPSLTPTVRSEPGYADVPVRADAAGNVAQTSGVSWPAVAGGAFVTAALSLILLALGAGLGLSSVSPWSNAGATASTVSRATILWLIFMQVASGAMGGYLAGRLRTKWANLHTRRGVFPRHRAWLSSWAVALVVTTRSLTTAATFDGRRGGITCSRRGSGGELQANAAGRQL